MRVVSKVASGSALLLVLLAGVLLYQLSLFRTLVRSNQGLSVKQLTASRLVLNQLRSLDGFDFFRSRVAVVSDPTLYLQRTDQHAKDFESYLDQLEALVDSSLEEGSADAPVVDYGSERALLGAIRRDWARLRYDPAWYSVAGTAATAGEVDPALALPTGIGGLETQCLALADAIDESMRQQLKAARTSSQRVTELSRWGIGSALALSLLVVFLTVRSINVPLKRMAKGTREIAEGHFDFRFDESRQDEFTHLASSFNRMVEKLGQLDQMKKDFVAHVSHELRSPLVTMQETNQLLADEIPGQLNPKQRRLIELNLDGGRRLSSMISNLLDLSSLEAGGMTFDFKAEDVVELLRFVISSVAQRASEKEVTLELGPPGEQLTIIAACDRDRTLQVIENLIENAVKFSPRGGRVLANIEAAAKLPSSLPEKLRARVRSVARARGFVYIIIEDEGPGVPDGEKEAIFEKFHQASNTAQIGRGGVGLGLAICGEIVEAHGGALWVTDRPAGGSCFHLLIPGPAPAVRRLDGGGASASELAAL